MTPPPPPQPEDEEKIMVDLRDAEVAAHTKRFAPSQPPPLPACTNG